LVKYEKDDLFADTHSILNMWKNYFRQLLNVLNGVIDVQRTEIHAAEPLVSESSASGVQIAVEKLKSINRHVLVKFRQKWSMQEAIQSGLKVPARKKLWIQVNRK
jgi:hypothetical protein